MTFSLQDEVLVVTGGAKRLGRAIAQEAAAAGASVAITYNHSRRDAEVLIAQLASLYPQQKFAAFQWTAGDAASAAQLKDGVLSVFDDVTALVNNAAIFRRTPFESLTEADFDDHIAANLKGPYLLCKEFGDYFLSQERGAIVNFADIHGERTLAAYVPYCISKAGVIMLTQTLAKALAPRVRVNCICPGTILEPSENQGYEDESISRIPMQRMGTPEEIAQTVMFLIGGPQFITGAVLPVDGGQRLR